MSGVDGSAMELKVISEDEISDDEINSIMKKLALAHK